MPREAVARQRMPVARANMVQCPIHRRLRGTTGMENRIVKISEVCNTERALSRPATLGRPSGAPGEVEARDTFSRHAAAMADRH